MSLSEKKPAMSAHSMADVIPFFIVFNVPFESNAFKKPKEYILHRLYRKNIRNIFVYLMFQQFLAYKHQGLRDSISGRAEVWHWSPTKLKISPIQIRNRAHVTNARIANK